MPIYEFVCHNCGSHFETIQSFSSTTTPACPTCESESVARQMSKPAIHFKGSGWYITDSKKADKQSANGQSENGDGEKSGEVSTAEVSTAEGGAEKKVATNGDTKASTEKKPEKSKSSTES
mgnify:CR=1 FL=1